MIREIVVDVDDAKHEVIFSIHWHGGQHSELRAPKPTLGQHDRHLSEDAERIIRDMAGGWPDAKIAATLSGKADGHTAATAASTLRRSFGLTIVMVHNEDNTLIEGEAQVRRYPVHAGETTVHEHARGPPQIGGCGQRKPGSAAPPPGMRSHRAMKRIQRGRPYDRGGPAHQAIRRDRADPGCAGGESSYPLGLPARARESAKPTLA